MAKIIAIHSFRRGTGKSNLVANIAALLAMQGMRVGIIDTNMQSPSIHILFGLRDASIRCSLNDYLWGRCDIEQTAYDVTPALDGDIPGRVLLVPSSASAADITRMLREGYDGTLLEDGLRTLCESFVLDVLLIDTYSGLNEETLLSLAFADVLAIILRPDQQDYQGTGVTIQIARKLGVPRTLILVNEVPSTFNADTVRARVEQAYGCEVVGVLPHSDELMTLASAALFVRHYPAHPLTTTLLSATAALMNQQAPRAKNQQPSGAQIHT